MQQTIVLPYLRNSPTRLPRRDLVITASDSLTLRTSIVESDDPSSPPLVLTGGIGGPAVRIVIYADYVPVPSRSGWCGGCGWDYGWGPAWGYGDPDRSSASILWSGYGVIGDLAGGRFDFFIPAATISTFPRRCGWAIQLSWDSGRSADLLAKGIIHVSGPMQPAGNLTVWTTDTYQPITTDDDVDIFA